MLHVIGPDCKEVESFDTDSSKSKCITGYIHSKTMDGYSCIGITSWLIRPVIHCMLLIIASRTTDINECDHNVCLQECVNTRGSYECVCYSGYSLNGTDCVGK